MTIASTVAGAQANSAAATFDSAAIAWTGGSYVEALTQLDRLLAAPGGDALRDSVALLTGELYRTTEIAPDGSNARWSADGRRILIDAGIGQPLATTVLGAPGGPATVPQTIAGAFGAVVSPDGGRIAYLIVEEDAELRAARARLDSLLRGTDGRAMNEQRGRIAVLERARTSVVERDFDSGRDRKFQTPDEVIPPLVYGPDGSSLYAIAREGLTVDVFALSESSAPRNVSQRSGPRSGLQALSGGKLMYLTGQRSFAILDPATGHEQPFNGMVPSLSADGSAVVFIAIKGDTNSVNVVRLDSVTTTTAFAFTTDPSGDGSRRAHYRVSADAGSRLGVVRGKSGHGETAPPYERDPARSLSALGVG
jgi:hypothetical protein